MSKNKEKQPKQHKNALLAIRFTVAWNLFTITSTIKENNLMAAVSMRIIDGCNCFAHINVFHIYFFTDRNQVRGDFVRNSKLCQMYQILTENEMRIEVENFSATLFVDFMWSPETATQMKPKNNHRSRKQVRRGMFYWWCQMIGTQRFRRIVAIASCILFFVLYCRIISIQITNNFSSHHWAVTDTQSVAVYLTT